MFPNISGTGVGLGTNNDGNFIYSGWTGAFVPVGYPWSGYDRFPDRTNRDFGTQFNMSASRSSSVYGDTTTNQPSSLRSLALIRAY